jgi:hypothetical protein
MSSLNHDSPKAARLVPHRMPVPAHSSITSGLRSEYLNPPQSAPAESDSKTSSCRGIYQKHLLHAVFSATSSRRMSLLAIAGLTNPCEGDEECRLLGHISRIWAPRLPPRRPRLPITLSVRPTRPCMFSRHTGHSSCLRILICTSALG